MLYSFCSAPAWTWRCRKRQASTVPSAYTSRPHTLCLNSRTTAGLEGTKEAMVARERAATGRAVLLQQCSRGSAEACRFGNGTAEKRSGSRPFGRAALRATAWALLRALTAAVCAGEGVGVEGVAAVHMLLGHAHAPYLLLRLPHLLYLLLQRGRARQGAMEQQQQRQREQRGLAPRSPTTLQPSTRPRPSPSRPPPHTHTHRPGPPLPGAAPSC